MIRSQFYHRVSNRRLLARSNGDEEANVERYG
jgi:hypothetical protein